MRLMKNTSSSMILDDSTIVAIATPVGIGAISIVRLSGERAYDIALKLTHKASLTPRYAHLCCIYDTQQNMIDEALVIYFPSPHSYTTQDVCEIQCHGGIMLAQNIMQICLQLGARMATPGEFTKRAFLGGRIDLAQAQAIASIIHSKSIEANKILVRQLRGDIGAFIHNIRESLLELLAFSEANIDYSEELDMDYQAQMLSKLLKIQSILQSVYHASQRHIAMLDGYMLGIIGKPNVGKSSLLNALLMHERAIVSDIEGTTRDSIEENLNINGALVKIIDTAGIRQSSDEIEQKGILKTKSIMQKSDILIALFDASRPFDWQDKAVLDMLRTECADKYILILINKNDIKIDGDASFFDDFLATHTKLITQRPLYVSVKNDGGDVVIHALQDILSTQSGSCAVILTSQVQIQSLHNALDSIKEAIGTLENGELELFSYHIQSSIESISHITQPYEHSQLLDKLFSAFCLGK